MPSDAPVLNREVAKETARRSVDAAAEGLIELSHLVHSHPELNFEEERSSAWVAGALSDHGFAIDTGVCDLPTAFVATAGSGPLTLAICAEYDALPGVGHACGHNIIAASAVGAAIGLGSLADDLGITVKVMGTPAEEGGGGKILMLERGAFAGVHASMMVHPMPFAFDSVEAVCLAVSILDVHYHGKSAHASGFPQAGINAADGVTIAQVAIGLLRQHIHPTDRIHGIVKDGGDAPNVIPEHAGGQWLVRARTLEALAKLEPRVRACFEAGAMATGATVEIVQPGKPYSEFRHDPGLGAFFQANGQALGREYPEIKRSALERTAGSTDMANISLAMPAIHPSIGIDCQPASNHQPEFTAAAITANADKAVRDGALAMAWTCIDVALDPTERTRLLAGP